MQDIPRRPRPPYPLIAIIFMFLIADLLLLFRMGSDILF